MTLPFKLSYDLHPIKASIVASHGLPGMIGYPPRLALGCKMIKSVGYSQESSVMT